MTNRMCVCCRKKTSKSELIRIGKKDKIPVIDQNKMQNGRAIYVCKNENCIEKLKKNNAISRFLKVQASDEFYKSLKNYNGDKSEC